MHIEREWAWASGCWPPKSMRMTKENANLCTEKKSVKCNATLFFPVTVFFFTLRHLFFFVLFLQTTIRLVVCFCNRYVNVETGWDDTTGREWKKCRENKHWCVMVAHRQRYTKEMTMIMRMHKTPSSTENTHLLWEL